jgi:hypothetical protein
VLAQRYVHVRPDVFLRIQQAVSKVLSKEIFASVKLAVNGILPVAYEVTTD